VIKFNPLSGTFDLVNPAPDLSGYVPYTGATADLNLGAFNLLATDGTFTSDVNISGRINLYDSEDGGFGYVRLELGAYQFYDAFGSAASISGEIISGTYGSFTNTVSAQSGTQSSPSFTFNGNSNTGLFSAGANTVQLTTNGSARFAVNTTQFTTTLPWRGQDGTTGAPAFSFSNDTNTGIWRNTTDSMAFSTNGLARLVVNNSGINVTGYIAGTTILRGANGTAAVPTFTFNTDADNGMYLSSVNTLGFSSAGTVRMNLSASALEAQVPIWTTTTSEQLRNRYNSTQYWRATTGSTGITTFDAVGTAPAFIFSNSVQFSGGTKSSDGSVGFTGTGAYTNFTIKDGIITAAS
jgi:hypothetical protein